MEYLPVTYHQTQIIEPQKLKLLPLMPVTVVVLSTNAKHFDNVKNNLHETTLKVKIFVQRPFGDQLFGFSRQGKFLGAKLY